MKYAYEALRAHFDEEFAHGQFIAHFLHLSPRLQEIRVGGRVAPGMAVCYREEREEVDRWVVIEDAAEAILTLDELGTDHPVSRALNGHQTGDSVTLSGTGIQPRSATIRDVIHKYVYRFRDCINQYQVRFPGGSACQLVHVGSGDVFDPTPIVKSLQDRRHQIEFLDESVSHEALAPPSSMHASPARLNQRRGLISRPRRTWASAASTGGGTSWPAALELARRCKTVVVDLTAVLTLAHLDLLRVLRSDTRSAWSPRRLSTGFSI